jgi:hypothetical protein
MKKTTFTLCLFFGLSTLLFAQNKPAGTPISGVVVDEADNEPLVGVTIRIAGKSSGTVTDLNGRFTVTVEPYDLIQILYTGYDPLELMPDEITQNLKNMVQLHSGTMLQEVVITGSQATTIICTTVCGPFRLFDNTEIPTSDENNPALLVSDLSFSYFPNPTVEGVTVTSSLIAGEIEVINPGGTLVKTQRITDAYTRITMTDLPSGMYYLHYRYKGITSLIGEVVLARD